MKLGIFGLPHSGKTTLFETLVASQGSHEEKSKKWSQEQRAIITLHDERIDFLVSLFHPKKISYAQFEIIDAPIPFDATSEALSFSFPSTFIEPMRYADCYMINLKNFDISGDDKLNPIEDLRKIESEFILSDMVLIEKRLERIEWAFQRGKKTQELVMEKDLLARMAAHLEGEKLLKTMTIAPHEEKMVKGYRFFSLKPAMVVLNSSELNFRKNEEKITELAGDYPTIECAGLFENELSQLDNEEDRQMFLADIGINESARNRLTKMAYQTLGLISFFTVGADEVKAWTLKKGETALDAAGTIHTDLARGFIRAECYQYDDLKALGSEKSLRAEGKITLKNKDQIIDDGTIVNIRFNV